MWRPQITSCQNKRRAPNPAKTLCEIEAIPRSAKELPGIDSTQQGMPAIAQSGHASKTGGARYVELNRRPTICRIHAEAYRGSACQALGRMSPARLSLCSKDT